MKIALFISPAHSVPPENNSILAPWWLVRDIADGLVERGHEVTLFGARGSQTKARLVDLGIDPFDAKQHEMSAGDYHSYARFHEQRLASLLYQRATQGEFDLIGNHLVAKTLPFTRFTSVPTVYTLHDPLDPVKIAMYSLYKDVLSIHYVSISNAQRMAGDLPFAGTIYHGLNLAEYPYSAPESGYLLAVGRIRPEKGFTDAIAAAKILSLQLVISGEYFTQFPDLFHYWQTEIQPHVDGRQMIHKGPMDRASVIQLYAGAQALLFPIKWEEPFGLVMIEAMACGTPVIAYNRGSVSEIVQDGVTGFIVEDEIGDLSNLGHLGNLKIKTRGVAGLVEAIRRIGEIDRAACRWHVEKNFTVEKMVEGYEAVYRKVLNKDK